MSDKFEKTAQSIVVIIILIIAFPTILIQIIEMYSMQ